MTEHINNIIDFGEVFNTIRRSQRELIINEIKHYCTEAHEHSDCDCDYLTDLINGLPYPGEVSE